MKLSFKYVGILNGSYIENSIIYPTKRENNNIEAEMPIYFWNKMTKDREVWRGLTKFDYEILLLMNEKNVVSPLNAMNISQILENISTTKKKSYSTAYRHLQNMTKQGYVRCGFVDGLASTYYIDERGISYCAAQTKCWLEGRT